jgi:hypothetical protein|tara:strand:- start:648 stop:1514 length:867 start_codon:yes stop_codon:yes gene_type:complete
VVDVDTALRASAYNDRKRKSSGDKDGGKSTPKKIEAFDPVAHAIKELADAYSMWLVILYGILVAVAVRYVLMPEMEEPGAILYLLPLLLAATIIPLHKIVLPKKYNELYTNGNWFRAIFLFVFTWLALSFILSNPPLADIAPPTLSGGIDIEQTEGIEDTTWKNGVYTINLNQDTVDVVLGMAVRDNVNAESVEINAVIYYRGDMKNELANGTAISHTDEIEMFESVTNWTRGNSIGSHESDIGMAWDLGTLEPGEYSLEITMTEQGDPWENTSELVYTILIIQTTVL